MGLRGNVPYSTCGSRAVCRPWAFIVPGGTTSPVRMEALRFQRRFNIENVHREMKAPEPRDSD